MSIEQAAITYIELRRSLGYYLERSGRWMPEFGQFVDREGTGYVTCELAVRWASREGSTSGSAAARRLSMVRLFAKHLSAVDPRTEIPPAGLLPYSNNRRPPYIYSEQDITSLLAAAGGLVKPFRAQTYTTILGLIAVTGMRIGEAIRLDRDDVDCARGMITIHKSKFDKSRLNPVHATTVDVLSRYASLRDREWPVPKTEAYFVSLAGQRLFHSCVHRTFLEQILPAAGLADRKPRRPRIHDLRHYPVHRIIPPWQFNEGAVHDSGGQHTG